MNRRYAIISLVSALGLALVLAGLLAAQTTQAGSQSPYVEMSQEGVSTQWEISDSGLDDDFFFLQWELVPDSPFSLYRFDGVYYPPDGKIYFPGGRIDRVNHDRSIWVFDPATSVYSDTGVDMPVNASNFAAILLNDATGLGIYVIGGYDQDAETNIDTVQVYYPSTNITDVITTDPFPGTLNGVPYGPGGYAVVDNKAYVFGGFESGPHDHNPGKERLPRFQAGKRNQQDTYFLFQGG